MHIRVVMFFEIFILDMGRGDDEHRLIARYAARLAQHNTMVIRKYFNTIIVS